MEVNVEPTGWALIAAMMMLLALILLTRIEHHK
jgi:hypothetical protein